MNLSWSLPSRQETLPVKSLPSRVWQTLLVLGVYQQNKDTVVLGSDYIVVLRALFVATDDPVYQKLAGLVEKHDTIYVHKYY